jgi:hypothetical protein
VISAKLRSSKSESGKAPFFASALTCGALSAVIQPISA